MNYFAKLFKGRLDRISYLLGNLMLWGGTFCVYWSAVALRSTVEQPYHYYGEPYTAGDVLWGILFLLIFMSALMFHFSLAIRRIHDLNESGWMSLLFFVPLINFFFWGFLILSRGTEGNNKYGAPDIRSELILEFFKYKKSKLS